MMKTILNSLIELQDIMSKGMQSIRVSLKKELIQHPSQINLKNVANASFNNERTMQRSRGIAAEINKTLREQPALTKKELAERKAELEAITYNRNYCFDVTDIAKAPTSKDNISGEITIRASGRKGIYENDDEIWLKAYFTPKVGEASIFKPDETETSSFMEWYFRVRDCQLEYYDTMSVNIDFSDVSNADRTMGLSMLQTGVYYVKFGLIRGKLIGGYGKDDRRISAVFDSDRGIVEFNNRTPDKYIEFKV